MSKFDEKTRELIAEYHHYQGDGLARPVKRIHHPDGGNAILVRFTNAEGVKCSSLDMIANSKSGDYATELFGVERKDEQQMIQDYLSL